MAVKTETERHMKLCRVGENTQQHNQTKQKKKISINDLFHLGFVEQSPHHIKASSEESF